MAKKYQAYGCVAPSGGIFQASEQMFDTPEEAEIEVQRLLGEVEEFWFHPIDGGKQLRFPGYWAQKIEEENGITRIVFE